MEHEVEDLLRDMAGGPAHPSAEKVVIPPPVLRPQHVYPPVAPLGMLSMGLLSKHKDEGGGGLFGGSGGGGEDGAGGLAKDLVSQGDQSDQRWLS